MSQLAKAFACNRKGLSAPTSGGLTADVVPLVTLGALPQGRLSLWRA